VTSWFAAVGADQKHGPTSVPGKHPPEESQNRGAPIGSLKFYVVVRHARIARFYIARQPHGFFDFAVVPLVFSNQEIRNSARVFEKAANNTCVNDGHVFAVEPRPETFETAAPS
jgi:hypothetical protein